MGGYGSGRRPGRPVAEQCSRLDLARIAKQGMLQPGRAYVGEQGWHMGGRLILRAQLVIDLAGPQAPRAILYRQAGDDWPRMQVFTLAATPQPKGGARYWWLCPFCRQRCRVLYLPEGGRPYLFACRRCWGCTYASSNESDKRVSAMASDIDALAAAYHADHWPTVRLWLRAHRLLQRRELHGLPPGRRRRLAAAYGLE